MANEVIRPSIMRGKMLFLLISALALAQASGEFMVLHAPNHVSFQTQAKDLPTSEISDVISSSFGYQLHHDMQWNGLGPGNLFKRPKANVVVSVAGLPKDKLGNAHVAKYNTLQDDPEVDTESVVNRIESSVDEKPLLVDFSVDSTVLAIRSHHPGLFTSLPATYDKMREVFVANLHGWSPVEMGSLNYTQEADLFFLGELYIMKNIMAAMRAKSEVTQTRSPDFYHFKVLGLQRLAKAYGLKSSQMRDAINLLQLVLDEVTQGFKDLYNGNVVVQMVGLEPEKEGSSGNILSRKSRSLLQSESQKSNVTSTLNLAKDYTAMYPIAFNIILWTMVVLALAVFAVAWGMWFMDPGRDSIIYRMTSQRIKKD